MISHCGESRTLSHCTCEQVRCTFSSAETCFVIYIKVVLGSESQHGSTAKMSIEWSMSCICICIRMCCNRFVFPLRTVVQQSTLRKRDGTALAWARARPSPHQNLSCLAQVRCRASSASPTQVRPAVSPPLLLSQRHATHAPRAPAPSSSQGACQYPSLVLTRTAQTTTLTDSRRAAAAHYSPFKPHETSTVRVLCLSTILGPISLPDRLALPRPLGLIRRHTSPRLASPSPTRRIKFKCLGPRSVLCF
jgi:hypothetical protein